MMTESLEGWDGQVMNHQENEIRSKPSTQGHAIKPASKTVDIVNQRTSSIEQDVCEEGQKKSGQSE